MNFTDADWLPQQSQGKLHNLQTVNVNLTAFQ